MENYVAHWAAKCIATVSYLFMLYSCCATFITRNSNTADYIIAIIAIILVLLKCVQGMRKNENDERKNFKWSWIDFIIVFLFLFRLMKQMKIGIEFTWFIHEKQIDLSHWVIIAFVLMMVLPIINGITSEKYGWGITRALRTFFLWFKYYALYKLLQSRHMNNSDNPIAKRIKERCKLSNEEYDLLYRAAKYRKRYKINTFPVLLRKDADCRSFLRKWLYNVSLVNGRNISLGSLSEGSEVKHFVQIDLTESNLAITNNSGKRFIRNLYDGNETLQKVMLTDNLAAYKLLKLKPDSTQLNSAPYRFSSDVFYRLGSAGALPIVKWKGKRWVAFVYRDIYPKGWNLPLGGSESELEKGRPGITAIREMFEEIIVTERALREYSGNSAEPDSMIYHATRREFYHHLLNNIEGEVNYQANKRRFYKQQNEIISQTCTFRFDDASENNTIECEDEATSFEICVKDENRINLKPRNHSTKCFIVVDCYEQAIECIKPVTFSIDDGNELRMGEVDYIEDKWINNPVILIDYEKLRDVFSKEIDYDSKDDGEVGEGRYLDFLADRKYYHIFGVNMEDRKMHLEKLKKDIQKYHIGKRLHSHKKYKKIKAQIEYLDEFIKSNERFFSGERLKKGTEKLNPGYYLCPVSWKSLHYYFSNFDNNLNENSAYQPTSVYHLHKGRTEKQSVQEADSSQEYLI